MHIISNNKKMITIKLREVMEKLGKNILDVARETGLHRNAVSSLFHGKVEGVKFMTLDVLCEAYGLQVTDLIEFTANEKVKDEKRSLYLQEGEVTMFTAWPFVLLGGGHSFERFGTGFGGSYAYSTPDYGYFYWDAVGMENLAKSVYTQYGDREKFDGLFQSYEAVAKEIESLYFANSEESVLTQTRAELLKFFGVLRSRYHDFWDASLFIDAFDAGFDQAEIRRIADQYDLSIEEISALTNPVELTYSNERIIDLIKLSYGCKSLKNVRKYVAGNEDVARYIKNYDYYKSNYAFMEHITRDEVTKEIEYYLENREEANRKFDELVGYPENQKVRVNAVLKKHKLKENPLYFFSRLTFWREHRKKINLMGIHLLYFVLKKIEVETGIGGKYLKFLSFDEVGNVLNGLIGETELKARYDKGVLISVKGDDYKMLIGEEAASLRQELDARLRKTDDAEKLYRQEGDIILFTIWPPFFVWNSHDKRFLKGGMGKYEAYLKGGYLWGYFRGEAMRSFAEKVYADYADMKKFDKFYKAYLDSTDIIKKRYLDYSMDKIFGFNGNEVLSFAKELMGDYNKFWSLCLFIDTFDSGFDQEEISRIAKLYGFSTKETGILTSPSQMTYSNERLLRLLKIIKELVDNNFTEESLSSYIYKSPEIGDYIREFEYYKSNYAHIETITRDEVRNEALKYFNDRELLRSELGKLENFEKDAKGEKKKILKQHGLSENPLEFFARLSYWREHRKKTNLMGIHLLFYVMMAIEKITGIPVNDLKNANPDEIEDIFSGKLTGADLRKRGKAGFMFLVDENGYEMVYGKKAEKLREGLEKQFTDSAKEEIITGFVASQGYARGIARVVLSKDEFDKFQEGEILVTGMTRPEFVPLMKKAAGIVTNEGGITCHAAIVSRELNKPCIIGTQIATQVIRDGDLVEVRANHGTVRILERGK